MKGYDQEKVINNSCLLPVGSTFFRYARLYDIDEIVKLDESVFDKHEIIDRNKFFEWHNKNPKIFTCLVDDNKVAGYFSILPLKKESLDKFLAGEVCEKSFTSNDILQYKDAIGHCRDFYFFSIAINSNGRKLFLRYFLNEIAKELQANNNSRNLYVTAAKNEGRALIERFNFRLVQKGACRADGHDLYVKEVDDFIKRIKAHRGYIKYRLDNIDKIY
jgi:hypothetical protein